MYSYPPEYLLHPVPVLAVYGLPETDEKLVDVEPTPLSRGDSLSNSLLKILTNKSEYTIYEATRYTTTQSPPPFRVITVSKVCHFFKQESFFFFNVYCLGLCFTSKTTTCNYEYTTTPLFTITTFS